MEKCIKKAPGGAVFYKKIVAQGNNEFKYRTPVKAIREYCIDCACGSLSEVRLCPRISCPLYGYRMGKRPKKTAVTGGTQQSSNAQESWAC